MPRIAANVSLMYAEHAFLDRFGAAARDGFRCVECQFPYEAPAAEVAARLREHGLQQVLINAPPGAPGERGIAALPGREAEFRRSFTEQALPYARALGCARVHVMAGTVPAGGERSACAATLIANLRWAAPIAAAEGITLMLEPLNPRDAPGYLYSRQAEAHAVVTELGAPNVKVQFDLYHCQISEGDVATKLREYLPTGRVGHIQFAGVPERHEPDVGELHHPYLFALIDRLGWQVPLGAEYKPRAATSAGLAWFQPYKEA
ncbi:MAG: 2-oxo-tetronate isomerase [Burkholderiaceae bacterium]